MSGGASGQMLRFSDARSGAPVEGTVTAHQYHLYKTEGFLRLPCGRVVGLCWVFPSGKVEQLEPDDPRLVSMKTEGLNTLSVSASLRHQDGITPSQELSSGIDWDEKIVPSHSGIDLSD